MTATRVFQVHNRYFRVPAVTTEYNIIPNNFPSFDVISFSVFIRCYKLSWSGARDDDGQAWLELHFVEATLFSRIYYMVQPGFSLAYAFLARKQTAPAAP